jgi:hypothetical protein
VGQAQGSAGLAIPAQRGLQDAGRVAGVVHRAVQRPVGAALFVQRAIRDDADGQLDPNCAATEPSWHAHVHSPSCEGAQIEQVVRVARYVDGGCARS